MCGRRRTLLHDAGGGSCHGADGGRGCRLPTDWNTDERTEEEMKRRRRRRRRRKIIYMCIIPYRRGSLKYFLTSWTFIVHISEHLIRVVILSTSVKVWVLFLATFLQTSRLSSRESDSSVSRLVSSDYQLRVGVHATLSARQSPSDLLASCSRRSFPPLMHSVNILAENASPGPN